MERLEALLRGMARNAIRLAMEGTDGISIGRFGGLPDVPPDFAWPYFETDTFYDDTVKPRPLSFLAQFDCAALAELDTDGLLPRTGILSFFYELGSQRWGYDPEDAGCAQAYWFPDKAVLAPAAFPEEMEESLRLPSLPIRGRSETEYPSYEEFSAALDLLESCKKEGQEPWEVFEEIRKTLRGCEESPPPWHRLLGWPNIIQGNMTQECELVSRGYSMGNGLKDIPEEVWQEIGETSLDNWQLLFQLNTVNCGEFELMFGDCGSIYFYIRKEDLASRRFDRTWFILQCC